MLWIAPLIVLYSYLEAQFIRVRRDKVFVPGLPPGFEGFTILHLSDLHCAYFGPLEKRLCRLLDEIETDLAVFTGDYRRRKTTGEAAAAKAVSQILPWIRSRLGAVGVLGNKDTTDMIEAIEDAGIEILSGRAKRLTLGNDSLWIAGIDALSLRDATRALISVTSQIPDGNFKILLSHGPDVAPLAGALGYALVLSGDTHGGQIRLPVVGAPVVKSYISRRYCRGIISEGDSTLCISCGIGTCAFPLRLFCPPELRILTLSATPGKAQA